MKKIRKFYIILLGILILLTTVSFAGAGTVDAPSGLVLRKEASKTGEPITTIYDKTEVEIIEKVGEWYKVKTISGEGYLFAEYVIEKEETPASNEGTNEKNVQETPADNPGEPVETEVVTETYPKDIATINNLKVYIIPSITASVTSNIEAGKTITINKKINDWAYITFEGKVGWVRNNLITAQEQQVTEETQTKVPVETPETNPSQETTQTINKKGYINVSSSANLREAASTSAKILTSLTTNTEVTISGEEGNWYKVTYKEYKGYISKELISDTQVEVTSRSQTTARQQIEPVENSETAITYTEGNSSAGEEIANFAKKYLGYSYVYGGTTPGGGFDCTGFTYYVYNNCGYSLSRSCSVQAKSGTSVSKTNLQPGDLLIFNNGGNGTIGHVGIYIGNGNFVHAANTRRGVVTDTINSGYYNTYYYDARRIV